MNPLGHPTSSPSVPGQLALHDIKEMRSVAIGVFSNYRECCSETHEILGLVAPWSLGQHNYSWYRSFKRR
jgi:hypothetical protein